jgi:hypothetical protein
MQADNGLWGVGKKTNRTITVFAQPSPKSSSFMAMIQRQTTPAFRFWHAAARILTATSERLCNFANRSAAGRVPSKDSFLARSDRLNLFFSRLSR